MCAGGLLEQPVGGHLLLLHFVERESYSMHRSFCSSASHCNPLPLLLPRVPPAVLVIAVNSSSTAPCGLMASQWVIQDITISTLKGQIHCTHLSFN